ncbi:dTDP-4-dehydrorhamnose 3,5-epimerase [Allomuricauda sp. M10]|jgi:dTDP-4-dehydrorhamnose 3,5-epimerase|uniref:dTDP-4-dehydrorhamnose 3,5-epimerase n=1 Tax=Allomuricauda sp. M10 TaxID=2683292 RepID=UPI0021D46187|nr:dTDP-4-dehydrorhamnose 3,5-epimerase [Muricauda sp. M10]
MIKVSETKIPGCIIIEPKVFDDDRGYFMESFNHKELSDALGLDVNFVQDNQSCSKKGVLRGLHFQKGKYAQAKLVFVPFGSVLDVVVDIRPESPTFGKHLVMELNGINKKQLFIPKGCAHGFLTLSDTALFMYKCDNYYNNMEEGGIRFDDPVLAIDWRLEKGMITLSAKDRALPDFKWNEY